MSISKYANLEAVGTEQMLILLTLNSLEARYYGLRDKMIEAVAEGAKQLKEEDFMQVLSK